jgi:hypothetical protein
VRRLQPRLATSRRRTTANAGSGVRAPSSALVLALALLATRSGLSILRRRRAAAHRLRAFLPRRLAGSVGRDLLHQPIGEPLGVREVAVIAASLECG